MSIQIKRAYDAPAKSDGLRVLVDRLWPRGIARTKVDLWLKDIAPSTGLRQWFGHDPAKWTEFKRRYRAELEANPALADLRALSRKSDVSLVYAAKDRTHNQAVVLKELLERGE